MKQRRVAEKKLTKMDVEGDASTAFERYLLELVLHSCDDFCKICANDPGPEICRAYDPGTGTFDKEICFRGLRDHFEAQR